MPIANFVSFWVSCHDRDVVRLLKFSRVCYIVFNANGMRNLIEKKDTYFSNLSKMITVEPNLSTNSDE